MQATTREKLLAILSEIYPQVCAVTDLELAQHFDALGASCEVHPLDLTGYMPASFAEKLQSAISSDLVVIAGLDRRLKHATCIEIVGSIRNHLNAKVVLIAEKDCPLHFNDMIGLGFKLDEKLPDGSAFYTYDIASYNKKREWNNSRFWANPENFDKYRW